VGIICFLPFLSIGCSAGSDESINTKTVTTIPNDPENLPVTFFQFYGEGVSDNACAVEMTADGGYVFCGERYTHGEPLSGMTLVKTDRLGHELWSWTYHFGVGTTAIGEALVLNQDQGFVVCGSAHLPETQNYWMVVIRVDATGEILWSKEISRPGATVRAASIIGIPDGGYLAAGSIGYSNDGTLGIVVKLNELGIEEWMRLYNFLIFDLHQTSDGGFVLVGSNGVSSAIMVKCDIQGNILWEKTDHHIHSFGAIEQMSNDDLIACGGYPVSYDAYIAIVRTDPQGSVKWKKFLGPGHANSIVPDRNGGFLIIGSYIYSIWDWSRLAIYKYDDAGNPAWRRIFYDLGSSSGWKGLQTDDDGFIVPGHAIRDGYSQALLMKTDRNGAMIIGVKP
jgi:hypothetical protein